MVFVPLRELTPVADTVDVHTSEAGASSRRRGLGAAAAKRPWSLGWPAGGQGMQLRAGLQVCWKLTCGGFYRALPPLLTYYGATTRAGS